MKDRPTPLFANRGRNRLNHLTPAEFLRVESMPVIVKQRQRCLINQVNGKTCETWGWGWGGWGQEEVNGCIRKKSDENGRHVMNKQ